MGCIDLHAWSSRVDRPERPDWVMFDLDPSEGSRFEEVVEVAQLVKQTLDLLELESYPKTSGSRGIHVLVPDRAAPLVRGGAGVRRDRRRRPRAGASRPRDDRVGEAEAARRARRREPERPGEDERERVLGAPASGRPGLDSAAVGRGRVGPRSGELHDGRRCSTGSRATATSSPACSAASSR